MRWYLFLLNGHTKCFIWVVSCRNTEVYLNQIYNYNLQAELQTGLHIYITVNFAIIFDNPIYNPSDNYNLQSNLQL